MFRDQALPLRIVKKLEPALVGKGTPPITSAEIFALADLRPDLRYDQPLPAGRGLAGDRYRAPAIVAPGDLDGHSDGELFGDFFAALKKVFADERIPVGGAELARIAFDEWSDIAAAAAGESEKRANIKLVCQRQRRWLRENRARILADSKAPSKSSRGAA